MVIVNRTRTRILLAALLIVASTGIVGCSKKMGTVSGKVTYGKKLVTSGEVLFLTQDGKAGAHAPVQSDGTYKATNVPVGTVKVALENLPPPKIRIGQAPPYEMSRDPELRARQQQAAMPPVQVVSKEMADDPEMKESAKRAASYVPTPPKYQDADHSGLTIEVRPGDNTYDIELR